MSDINNEYPILYTYFRKGTSDDPYKQIQEERQIHNCTIRLSEIPQKQYRVAINDSDNNLWYEIDDGIPSDNQYLVDYNTGIISFAISNEAKSLTFSYLGVGIILLSGERVQIAIDNNVNAETSLQQLIDQNRIEGNLAHRKSPVNTYADLTATYPNPVNGDMAQALDTNKMYIWNGQDWYWFYTFPTQQLVNLQNNVTDIYNKIGDLNKAYIGSSTPIGDFSIWIDTGVE